MAIENRSPEPGTKFTARYKASTHTCEVVATEQGIRYRLEDGREFRSPSAAGSAIMGGIACNGWRFWSLEGTLDAGSPGPAAARKNGRKPSGKMVRVIKRVPNQKGVEEGHTKWHCSACQKSFVAEGTVVPANCPEGHAAEAEDDLAPVN